MSQAHPFKRDRFLPGMALGVVVTLIVGGLLVFPVSTDLAGIRRMTESALAWVGGNLGWSLPLFGALLVLFGLSLQRLRHEIRVQSPIETVAQQDHLVDIWINLFFGVGVIWTAIGMRSALVFALGDPGDSLDAGARAILQRMVEGGILLALSTTIVGGIGGYLLRVIKAITVETDLKRYYDQQAHAPTREIQALLASIDARLQALPHRDDEDRGPA
jgi:hypothetical protein